MKRALIVASVASMIDQFNIPSIKLLQQLGYEVSVACNFEKGSSCSMERIAQLKEKLQQMGVACYHINCPRSIVRLDQHIKAFLQLRKLASENHYSLMHCHSPIGGMLARLAFRNYRRRGTTVIYTAHGFHFYRGAPAKNWCLFYPVEKLCSRFTDILITINQEDTELARKRMRAGRVIYVPGVGVDTRRFINCRSDKTEVRKQLGIPEDAFLLMSVGELNQNKNHSVVLRAMKKAKNDAVHYAIVGKGHLRDSLLRQARDLGLENRVHLLGYRSDVPQLYHCADVCVFPSIREGQGLAAIEGMAAGLPLIVSDNRGTRGFLVPHENAFVCAWDDAERFAEAINDLSRSTRLRQEMGQANVRKSGDFDVAVINRQMEEIYRNAVNE